MLYVCVCVCVCVCELGLYACMLFYAGPLKSFPPVVWSYTHMHASCTRGVDI